VGVGVRILLVEDNPSDAVLVRTWLRSEGVDDWLLQRVESLDEALQALADGEPDAVLLELHLPDSTGLLTLERIVGVARPTPVLVMTGHGDAELEDRALRLGAADFIAKSRVSGPGLVRALRNASRRAQLLDTLRRSQQSFRAIVQRSGDGQVVCTGDGGLLYANPAALVYADLQGVALKIVLADGTGDVALTLPTRSGDVRAVLASRSVTSWEGVPAALLALRDVTLVRQAEARARAREAQAEQAERLGGLGRLAGGIAHEFNNLLMVIQGHAELLAGRSDDPRVHRHAGAISHASDRAAAIARQLRVFASRDRTAPEPVELAQAIRATLGTLRDPLGDGVVLDASLGPDAIRCSLVPGQLEQVLINLVSNARDAMPGSGRITLSLVPEPRDSRPGVCLTVQDDGAGMDAETRSRALEPFFTTKDVGGGTGLGLSAVYGIVRQAGGELGLDSTPGVGTRVSIWLPLLDAPDPPEVPAALPAPQADHGVILVAEDEPALRMVVATALTRAGHEVLEAEHPAAALALPAADLDRVQVLVSDYAMPGASGLDLYRRLSERLPGLGFILVSGYTRGAQVAKTDLPPHGVFLQKPFALRELQVQVSRQLELRAERT